MEKFLIILCCITSSCKLVWSCNSGYTSESYHSNPPKWMGKKVQCSKEYPKRINFCLLYPFEVSREEPRFIPVSGDYASKSITGLQFTDNLFRMSQSRVPVLTNSACETLPNLSEFLGFLVEMEEIEENSFWKCQRLTRLLLNENRIYSLKKNTFNLNTALEILDLHDNQLQVLDVDIFKNLKNLKILALDCNKLNYLLPQHFKDLANLITLNLDSNRLTHLDIRDMTLTYTPFIQQISLQHNDFRCDELTRLIIDLKMRSIEFVAPFNCNKPKKRDFKVSHIQAVECFSDEQYERMLRKYNETGRQDKTIRGTGLRG